MNGKNLMDALGLQEKAKAYIAHCGSGTAQDHDLQTAARAYSRAAASCVHNVKLDRELEIARVIGREARINEKIKSNVLINTESLHLLTKMECSAIAIYGLYCFIGKDFEFCYEERNGEMSDVIKVRLQPAATSNEMDLLDLSIQFNLDREPVWWEGNFLRFERGENIRNTFGGHLPTSGERVTLHLKDKDQEWFDRDLTFGNVDTPGFYEIRHAELTKLIPFF